MKTATRIFNSAISIFSMMIVTAGTAQAANISLPATHQIISQQQMANGRTTFAIRLTITNSSATSLTNLSFHPSGPDLQLPFSGGVAGAPLIASLAAGATVTLNFHLEGLTPRLVPGMLLMFQGMAANAAGQPVEVLINSEGV